MFGNLSLSLSFVSQRLNSVMQIDFSSSSFCYSHYHILSISFILHPHPLSLPLAKKKELTHTSVSSAAGQEVHSSMNVILSVEIKQQPSNLLYYWGR